MRRWLFVLTLAACTHSGSSGPAWPKDRTRADGGESIAPRETATAVAAVEKDADDDDDAKPAEKPADKPAEKAAPAAAEGGAPATSAAAPSEDPMTTEEIVIEIGPDD